MATHTLKPARLKWRKKHRLRRHKHPSNKYDILIPTYYDQTCLVNRIGLHKLQANIHLAGLIYFLRKRFRYNKPQPGNNLIIFNFAIRMPPICNLPTFALLSI